MSDEEKKIDDIWGKVLTEEEYAKWNKDAYDTLEAAETFAANVLKDRSITPAAKADILNALYFHVQCVAAKLEGIMIGFYGQDASIDTCKTITSEARAAVAKHLVDIMKEVGKLDDDALDSLGFSEPAIDPDKVN